MKKNVFKELEKELEEGFVGQKDEEVKMQVKGSVNSLSFIAELFELFVSHFFGAMIGKGKKK